MNTLFSLFACPYCNIAAMAVEQANLTLPLHQHISMIEVLPQEIYGKAIGNPRLAFLAKLYDKPSMAKWGFPILLLDNVETMQRFNTVMFGLTGRVIVKSAYSHKHYLAYLREYLGG